MGKRIKIAFTIDPETFKQVQEQIRQLGIDTKKAISALSAT